MGRHGIMYIRANDAIFQVGVCVSATRWNFCHLFDFERASPTRVTPHLRQRVNSIPSTSHCVVPQSSARPWSLQSLYRHPDAGGVPLGTARASSGRCMPYVVNAPPCLSFEYHMCTSVKPSPVTYVMPWYLRTTYSSSMSRAKAL